MTAAQAPQETEKGSSSFQIASPPLNEHASICSRLQAPFLMGKFSIFLPLTVCLLAIFDELKIVLYYENFFLLELGIWKELNNWIA